MRDIDYTEVKLNSLEWAVETYINGNIKDAKKWAKGTRKYDQYPVYEYLKEYYGYSDNKAALTSAHIFGADCFQQVCDAD